MHTATTDAAKSQNKGTYRRRRFVMLMLACFLSWAGVTLWNQVGRIEEQSKKIGALEQKLADIKQINEGYKFEITRWNDPEYESQQIRKELHYVKPGETLFMAPQPK